MVVCSPCEALIERAKLTIDLILTSITAHTLSARLWFRGHNCLRRPPEGGPLVFLLPYPSGLCLCRYTMPAFIGFEK